MTRCRTALPAFTLVEMAIIIAVVGLLAVSAIPAMDVLDSTRQLSAVREIERRLINARATAMSTGLPSGLLIDTPGQSVRLMTIPLGGSTPIPATAATGEPEPAFSIPAEFPGVRITGLRAGDGSSADTTYWFSFEGVPELRNGAGVLQGGFSEDAWIELTGGNRVHIRRESGLVER